MYGGSGVSPAGSPSSRTRQRPSPRCSSSSTGAVAPPGAQPPRRPRERLPQPVAELLQQQHLALRGCSIGIRAGHDARVVDDDERVADLRWELAEAPVPDAPRRAVVDQQPRLVAPRRPGAGRSARAGGRSRARMTSSGGHAIVAPVDEGALDRARERLAEAAEEGRSRATSKPRSSGPGHRSRRSPRPPPSSNRRSRPGRRGGPRRDPRRGPPGLAAARRGPRPREPDDPPARADRDRAARRAQLARRRPRPAGRPDRLGLAGGRRAARAHRGATPGSPRRRARSVGRRASARAG